MKVPSSLAQPIDLCLPLHCPLYTTVLPFICISQTNSSAATCIDPHRQSKMCWNTPLRVALMGVQQQPGL